MEVFQTIVSGKEDAVVSHTCSLILTLMRLFEGIATYFTGWNEVTRLYSRGGNLQKQCGYAGTYMNL